MNAKHKRTLAEIFAKPMPKAMPYRDIESLLLAIGNAKIEGGGSKVRFVFSSEHVLFLHRPHPRKELLEYQIKDVKEYLLKIGAWE